MLTTDLRQLAKDYEMAYYERDFVYRNLNGFIVSVFPEGQKRMLVIQAILPETNRDEIMQKLEEEIVALDEGKKIIGHTFENNEFAFTFSFKADIYYYIGNFMDAFTKKLGVLGAKSVNCCFVCEKQLSKGNRYIVNYDNSAKVMHLECEKKLEEQFKGKKKTRSKIDASVGKGIASAIIGAIATAPVWALLEGFKIFPFIAGGVIGYIMKKVYDIGAGKPGFAKMLLITLGNIAAIFMGYMSGSYTKYVLATRAGTTTEMLFKQVMGNALNNIADEKFSLLLGLAIATAVCYDVYIFLGKKSSYVEEEKPFIKHIKSF